MTGIDDARRWPGAALRRRLAAVLGAATLTVGLAAGPLAGQGAWADPRTAAGSLRPAPASAADAAVADWTMLVYAVADTEGIGGLMTDDLAELTALSDDPDVNIVVLVDMPDPAEPGAGRGALPGTGPFTTAKLLKLEGGRFEEVRDLGELPMGRPDTLAAFIEEAADRFPARHYGLTLMDHGGAYTGGYLDLSPSSEMMSVPDLRAGMISGLQRAGIDRFDVLFHSACLMSSYEAASALGPLAGVMAGSEEVMYVFAMLQASGFAAAQAGGDGQAVGEAFVDGYVTRIEEEQQRTASGTEDFDLLASIRDLVAVSVVDGGQMANLDRAMQSFSDVAVAHMDEIVTQVARARAETLEFMVNTPGVEETGYDLVDLGDFLAHLRDLPPAVEVARDAAYAALTRAVTHQVTGRGTEQATGLNVYLPRSEYLGDYLDEGSLPSGWSAFLESFLAAAVASGDQPGTEPAARFTSPDAQVLQADETGIKVAGQLVSGGSAAVVDQETQVYTRVGDRPDVLALVLPAYLDAGGEGQVQGIWDYSLTTLTDDQKVVPASAVYQAQAGGLIGSFLARYVSPAGDASEVGVRVLLSSQGDIESVSTFALNDDGGSTAGVTLEVGGRLTPYLLVPSSEGFIRQLSSQSIAVSEQLAVSFDRLPAGTDFDLGVVVSDASGGADGAFTTQKVR